jgi:hypothetical protein
MHGRTPSQAFIEGLPHTPAKEDHATASASKTKAALPSPERHCQPITLSVHNDGYRRSGERLPVTSVWARRHPNADKKRMTKAINRPALQAASSAGTQEKSKSSKRPWKRPFQRK